MTSIYDIARAAGTSIATVSYVLNKSDRISPATRERVLKAIKDLNYQPKASARALASGRTLTITLVAPMSIYSHQVSLYMLINGIGRALEPTDYRLYIHPTLNRPDSLFEIEEAIRSRQMDGVILMHITANDPRIPLLRQNNIPFVLIGRSNECDDISWVDADIDAAVDTAIKHFISKGHKKIGMLGERGEANITNQLIWGFKKSIIQNGLTYDPKYCLEFSEASEEIDRVIGGCLSLSNRPTAFFAVSDLAVLGIYKSAARLGLRIPQDVSVIGYADSSIYPYMSPPCSAVFSSATELGRLSAELLLAQLGGEKPENNHILFPPRLIERESILSI